MQQRCSRCTYEGPIDSFPFKKGNVGHVKTCHTCTTKATAYNKNTRQQKAKEGNKENINTQEDAQEPVEVTSHAVQELAFVDVLALIQENISNAFELDCTALLDDDELDDIKEEAGDDILRHAHAIARRIRSSIGWRFKYVPY